MEPMEQAGAVLLVLALLGLTLYALRGKAIPMVMMRRAASAGQRQLESIERLPLTPHHSLHLIRVEDRTVLVAVSPNGCSILDRAPSETSIPHGGLIR